MRPSPLVFSTRLGSSGPPQASGSPTYFPPRAPAPWLPHPSTTPHHLLNLVWLLYRQAQQLVSCDLHVEGVENPNLFGVDVPDEGRLFPESLSHLGGWGWKARGEWVETCFSSPAAGLLQGKGSMWGWRRVLTSAGGEVGRSRERGEWGSPQGSPGDMVRRVWGLSLAHSQ